MKNRMGCAQLKIIAFLLSFAVVSGCDQSPKSLQQSDGPSAASEFTIASNKAFVENLDLDNQQDFEDARRGMVAEAPNSAVISQSGVQVWDASDYDFIVGGAPDTVNPSLWRQAKLNNIRGLFKVDEVNLISPRCCSAKAIAASVVSNVVNGSTNIQPESLLIRLMLAKSKPRS